MSLQNAYKSIAVTAVFSLLAAAAATAQQSSSDPHLRIAIELAPHKDPRGPEPSIVERVERGIVKQLPKGSVTRVEPPETSDVKILVRYEATSYFEGLTATVDGRRLQAPVQIRFNRWNPTAEALGRDIALVLQARIQRAAGASRATDIGALLRQLDGRHPVERASAAAQLGSLGPAGAEATNALVQRLGDDGTVRVVGPNTATTVGDEAAKALLHIGATTALLNVVRSEADGSARARALREVSKSTMPELPSVVMAALDDRSREVRTEATWVSGRVLGKSAIPKLIEIIGRGKDRPTLSAAHENLKHLTGQDFGLSADKWREWNASQRAK